MGALAALSSSTWHTCALDKSGDIFCWGRSERGQADPPVVRDESAQVRAAVMRVVAVDR